MIQLRSMLKLADNSGAKELQVIGIPGRIGKKASVGDVVRCVVKGADPAGAVNDKEKITDTLYKIKTAVNDGIAIIHRIKMFYKSKQMEEPISTIDTNQLIQEILDFIDPILKNMFNKKGISVKIECEFSAISPVQMRRSDFRETIINLIINAAEAIPKNGIIQITTREDLDNKMVIISISDNGTGMSLEIQKHCFDPFYSTKGDTGTGIGLSMIADIIKSYQGTIKLESKEGQGSTFSLGLRCT